MRVLLVTSLTRGGPLEHALLLARELSAAGVDVGAVCADADVAARFEAAGAAPAVIPLRPGLDLRGGRAVDRLARDFDVVHAQDRRAGLWTRVWPRRDRAARVYTVHGLPDPYLPPPAGPPVGPSPRDWVAYRGVDAALARRSDAVVAPSTFIATEVQQRLGYPADRLVVIPNGVELPPPRPHGDRVATISTLEPVKGLDCFVRAAALVRRRRPETRFAIFGDGSAAAEIESLVRSLELDDVLEMPGHVPLEQALGQVGTYVLCSWLENCPMSLLEAMAAGVPAVATAVGGVPEVAGDGVALVRPGDERQLAEAILATLERPDAARERAARARAAVESRFSAARNAAATLALYRRLTGEPT